MVHGLGSRLSTRDARLSNMLSVALTGNIGAGKSTVATLFQRWGATVIDADALVREAQAPGSPALAEIAAHFGPGVIRPDGTLDRPALRRRVLDYPDELTALNRIMHPRVQQRRLQLVEQARTRGDRIIVSEIPLLFEAADPSAFDVVILVDAPEELRRQRLLGSRDLTAGEVDRLMAAQLGSAAKRQRSHFVIDNDSDPASLEREAASVWKELRARA
jgi:dephospho-CoA kinase